MLEVPCNNCPDRTSTCHGSCDKYFVFNLCKEYERNLKLKEAALQDDLFKTSRHNNGKKRRKPYADSRGGY